MGSPLGVKRVIAISAWATIKILMFPPLLGFTDQGKYTDGVQNMRNYSLTPPKVNYSTDNPSSKFISSGKQSHSTVHGERLLYYSVPYIYVQTNKFVCLLGNKNSFDGFIGFPVLFTFFLFWLFVCFFDVKGIEFPSTV